MLVTQSCLTLCHPMDCNPPDSSVHGIHQARILEWVAMPCSRGSSQPRDRTQSPALQADALPSEPPGKPLKLKVESLSRVQLLATPWTVTHQAPPSMGFSRQEYWRGLPFPSPGDLPNPLIAGRFHTISTIREAPKYFIYSPIHIFRKQ